MNTDVAIIGGGPAGLMLAIELGCRGIACTLLEEDATCPVLPKANATSARTMEHYRRRGFAGQIRALGLPDHHAQDIVYTTRIAGRELTRFQIPSAAQARAQTSFGDYGPDAWPTPELPHRAQQMYIEPILKAQAESHPSVTVRFGARAMAVADQGAQVRVDYVDTASGQAHQLQARYVVGCDGPRSLVRKTCGIEYSGHSKEQREFFGGQMLSLYFTSASLYQVLGKQRAWMYVAVNAVQRGMMVSIDGQSKFMFCLQLKPDQTPESVDYQAAMFAAIGAEFDYQLIAKAPWQAGFTLVADRFKQGRAFIAGDAAHLFTPTGGMGYNTSVDDAVNLGWKLAAVVQGWAGEALLDSYEAERKPIAHRNTSFARAMADSIGGIKVPAQVDLESAGAAPVRQQLGDALAQHVKSEFNIPGLQLGLRYEGSPIIASDATPPTADQPNTYIPSARPGARAPHMWLDGKSIFDLFGRDFTLLCCTPAQQGRDIARWQGAATQRGLPLDILYCDNPDARALYGADRVLIRPDHHVAWRGDANAHAEEILTMVCGRRVPALQS